MKHDSAVSPVIGTILMIAATVVLGGVIYAAIGGFSKQSEAPAGDAPVFKAVQREDGVRVTYLSGPDGVEPRFTLDGLEDGSPAASWRPGDSYTFLRTAGATGASVTVTVGSKVVLDATFAYPEDP